MNKIQWAAIFVILIMVLSGVAYFMTFFFI